MRLLAVSSDAAHNRSVLTLVGDAASLEAAVRALFEAALPRIDLTKHMGEHPRMGAVDVVPFIPIRVATVEDCVALSRRVGEAIGRDVSGPRLSLRGLGLLGTAPQSRGDPEGGVRGLRREDEESRVEAGLRARPAPSDRRRRGGRGARPPLIAYNINLGTRDLVGGRPDRPAIRHSGGGFRYVKAMGVELADRGQVQVSINMTNFQKTPLHRVFECVRSEAERHGVPIVGSEIVGLTPAEALYTAAEHYPADRKLLERSGPGDEAPRGGGIGVGRPMPPPVGHFARIYSVVSRIPRGKVATYGQVARLASLSGQARLVGYALGALGDGSRIPWHRVVNAQGKISPRGDGGPESRLQRRRLERERVRFDAAGAISLARFRWRPRGGPSRAPAPPRYPRSTSIP